MSFLELFVVRMHEPVVNHWPKMFSMLAVNIIQHKRKLQPNAAKTKNDNYITQIHKST